MALTYDQITAITEKYYIPKLVDNVYGSNALLSVLDKVMVDGGESIMAPIIHQEAGVGQYYSGFEALDTTPTDDITSVNLAWKQAHEPIKISGLQELQNAGSAAKLRLVSAKMMVAEKNLKELLADGLFSDGTASTGASTTSQITGLQAILSTTSTYGGLSVTDAPAWKATVKANSGTNRPLTLNLIQSTQGAVTFDADRPDVGTMNQNIFDVLWSLLQPYERLSAGSEMADVGFISAKLNGVKYYVDSHQEANSIYLLNTDYLKLYVHRQRNFKFDKIQKLESQDASVGRIFWMGNLVCNGRRFQGKLDDITASS